MRIIYIAAGAAGMYCGACARDIALVRGLIKRGHDIEIVPLYTPLRTEGDDPPDTTEIFYGGVNVYLQQLSAFFRKLPGSLDRWLDNASLLRWVSRFAINTKASDLGPMTVSVLSGKDGLHRKELNRLLDYLVSTPRPDLVNITNTMLSSIAPEIKNRLGCPVVCNLQGEDSFVDAMPEVYASKARRLMQENSTYIDMFIAPGENYALKMESYLNISKEKIAVAPPGVEYAIYKRKTNRSHIPFTIGYLSSIIPGKGLDLLVKAVAVLMDMGINDLRLRVAGKILSNAYFDKVMASVKALGMQNRFEYLGEIDLSAKVEFLNQCSIFVLPGRIPEARGIAVMEAMANGLPVVAPNSGIFPELIGRKEAGVLFASDNVDSLTEAVKKLYEDRKYADTLGFTAADLIKTDYNVDVMTERVLEIYSGVVFRQDH